MEIEFSFYQRVACSVTITGHGKALIDRIIEVEGLEDSKIVRAEIRAAIADDQLLDEHLEGVTAFLADLVQDDLKSRRVEISDFEDPEDIEIC